MNQRQFDQLLFSHSHDQIYDDNEGSFGGHLSSGLDEMEQRFINENQTILNQQNQNDSEQEGEDENDENEEEFRANKQLRHIFPTINGPSYNCNDCSQNSMSMSKRLDDIEPRQSEKSEIINIDKFIENKRKEQYFVNEVIDMEVNQLLEEQEKFKVIIEGYKNKVKSYEEEIHELRKQNEDLEELNKKHLEASQRKNELYSTLRETCTFTMEKLQEKEKKIAQLLSVNNMLGDEIDRLKQVIKSYTDQERNLTEFRSLTPKRSHEVKDRSNFKNTVDKDVEKLKREKASLEAEQQVLKDEITKKQSKLKSVEEELKKKISTKDKRIKELEEYMKDEISKVKKNSENSLSVLKEKMYKAERQIKDRDDKIQELEKRNKMHLEQLKKKEEKINHVLIEASEKNKKINEINDKLKEEEAKNAIDSKIQVERENHIDKLEKEIKNIKTEKFTLEKKLSTNEKDTNAEAKLKKELGLMKKELERKEEELQQANNELFMMGEEANQKDKKIKELKKKYEEVVKKNSNIKMKTSDTEELEKQLIMYKQKTTKLSKQLTEYKKKLQESQQKANRQYILETMGTMVREDQNDEFDYENQFQPEEQIEALEMAIEEREKEIKKLKYSHKMEVERYEEELETLKEIINQKESELEFREKSIDYLHEKYLTLEKQKAELQINRNILHSSFYDQSYDDDETIKFYENKVQMLEDRLKDKENQLEKMKSSFEGNSSKFQINQLKNRIKQLNQMVLANQKRKIAPESLSPDQTLQFLLKTLKRVYKSGDMIRMLSRQIDFREIILSMHKLMEKQARRK